MIFRLRNMRPDSVLRALAEILGRLGEALERGAVVSATEGQIRGRLLPLRGPNDEP